MIESIEVINENYLVITDVLYVYLREMFYKNNHPKYKHYFEEWVNNLTPIQIFYFEKQRQNIIYGSNIKH